MSAGRREFYRYIRNTCRRYLPPTLTRHVIRIISVYRLSICCSALTLALLSFDLTDLFDQFLFMLAKSGENSLASCVLSQQIGHYDTPQDMSLCDTFPVSGRYKIPVKLRLQEPYDLHLTIPLSL